MNSFANKNRDFCFGLLVGNIVFHSIFGDPIKGLFIGALSALISYTFMMILDSHDKP